MGDPSSNIELKRGEKADVIDYFGDRQICSRCGANISTYADQCSADLGDPCEGFETIERFLSTVRDARNGQPDG